MKKEKPIVDDDGLVSHVHVEKPADVEAYWTEERRNAAVPVEMPRVPASDPPKVARKTDRDRK